MSPMRYPTVWRLQAAAHSLRAAQSRIADVAEEVGYGSEEAFSRASKRFFGVSPNSWRSGSSGTLERAQAAAHDPVGELECSNGHASRRGR
jgi:AraC-like DNA-binding protein